MKIRPEKPNDLQKIREVHIQAFDTDEEADLVDALRASGVSLISLVADDEGALAGHILFSPVTLGERDSTIAIAGLAPVAVVPSCQKRGIGSLLVKEGLKSCRESGYTAVVVLGHPDYYRRFGFVPSVRYGIQTEYDVPDEYFMIKELESGALKGFAGTVKYHRAFSQQ